jgi:hypothetical protein
MYSFCFCKEPPGHAGHRGGGVVVVEDAALPLRSYAAETGIAAQQVQVFFRGGPVL